MKRGSVFAEPLFFGGMAGTKAGDFSQKIIGGVGFEVGFQNL